MLPILARAAGGSMARKIMGRKKNVRVGQAQPQSSNAIVKSEKFTGRSTKASTALVRPPAPMKKVSGGMISKDDPIKVIHVKTLQIESILVGTLASEKAELKRKKSDFKNQSRQDQEDKLEKKDLNPNKKMKMPKVPGTGGIFGFIKNFIGNILMGIFLTKMIDHVDKLKGIVIALGKVADFVSEVGIKLVDGLATFVDWGYKAYDATQGFLKNFGVQPELFDQFAGALSGIIDALIIGSIILAARGEDGFGPGGLDKARRPGGRKPGVTQGRGGQQPPRFRNPLRRNPVTRSGKPGMPGAPVTQGRGGQKPGTRIPGTGPNVTGGTPKVPSGGLSIFKRLRRFLKPVPLLGTLLNIVFGKMDYDDRKAQGQTDVQATAGAGGGILGSIIAMATAAALIPEPTSTLGGLAVLGLIGLLGMGGETVGSAVADKATGADKVGQYEEGGKVRKKPSKKPVARTIGGRKKKAKINNIVRRPSKEKLLETPPKVDPMSKTAETQSRAWWDFLGWAGTGKEVIDVPTQELTDKVADVGNKLGRDDYFGPLLRSTSKVILDQKITSKDVRNVGLGINYLIAQGLQNGKIERGLKAYSEGGDVNSLVGALDVTSWVEDTFKKTAKIATDTPNISMGTGTGTGTGTTPGSTPGPTSGTPFSGNMKGAQIGEQHLLDAMKKYNYTGDPAALMAIVKGESNFQATEEMMYVSADNAYGMFRERFRDKAHAQQLIDAGKKAFFDHVYQPKYVSMNEKSDDGYRYIGRGHIQLTGRSNYREVGKIIGRDLEGDPMQILNNPTVSAEAAVGFMIRGQKQYGQGVNDIESALRTVGGSETSWPKKRQYYEEYKKKIQSGQVGNNTPTAPNVKPGSSQPASSNIPDNISSGTGGPMVRSAKGTKLAGDLGRYIQSELVSAAQSGEGYMGGDYLKITEHPDFGGSFKRNYASWHNVDRGIDIGGFWPKDQKKILAKVLEFNEKRGVQPVELLYGKAGTPESGSHGDHVHVAYEKGGMTLDGPHMAMIGEKGREIVIDNDSSVAEVTPMLLAINAAKDKQGVLDAIRDYAPYDERSNQVVVIDDSDSKNMQDTGDQGGSTMILPLGGTSYDNSFDFLDYQG